MEFAQDLHVKTSEVLAYLGYRGKTPDRDTLEALQDTAAALEAVVQPRWCFKSFAIGENFHLGGWKPGGQDIQAHLAGCDTVVLLGVTLGQEADALLRRYSAADMHGAVLVDTAASVLAEQYADAAGEALAKRVAPRYTTPRFSPGYGDFPLADGRELVRLLDAPRAIGLTVGGGGALLPTKSITALVGVADTPVQGKLAGCATCALDGNCENQKEGKLCGKTNF